MIPHDCFTQEEIEDYCQHHEPRYHRIRHTTGCDACDEEQKLTGRTNAMCKICERQMLAEEGNR